ncbi:MAG: hypothetical protein Q8911_15610, partial [Bacillota bacterium]|nr:hypothetical protein [Bacillota bacterium]
MRIERIRVTNLKESGNIDWTLPPGPTCYFLGKKSSQRVLNFLLRVFYNYETPSTPVDLNSQGSIEVWVSRDNSRYHIHQSITQMGDDSLEGSPTLVIEDENRISVSLPNSTTLGEFLFRVKSSAFLQGGVIEWPLQSDGDDLLGLVRNLRNGGDEKFSLAKVRDSISGALKKVNNQMGNMVFVKAEYDTLRRDWEIAHRQREEQQLLLIELKNLQERERILDERLIAAAKLEERIDVLTQNPDYRELRQLQVEVTRLKDLCRDSEVDLLDLTHNSLVDWTMVERLREECIEWANCEKQVEHITAKVKKREEYINELGSFLKSSGYRDLDEDAVE